MGGAAMREYDITHEARFDADPHDVFQAVIDEGTGKAHWWRPVRFEYTEGDFVGESVWTFERADGQTLLRFRWHVRPNRLAVRLALPFMNLRGSHSKAMEQGFENLRTYLKAREAVA